jgi:predicted lysophospholipase L1 biosynthesis ABC-type transport system permease subunit
VIDEHMAQALWPGEDALGKRFRMGAADSKAPWTTVVGVVGRVKQYALDGDSRIAAYFPHAQYPARAMNVVLRTRGDPPALVADATRTVESIAPDLPIYNVRTMEDRVEASLARRRFSMLLLTIAASLALGLAAIGIYGVMAYLVDQGTRELGIRIALGATPVGIAALVLRHGMTLAAAGVAVGIAGAFALSRVMEGLLFGISATDAHTFVAVPLFLGLVALAACYLPARRAASIDPIVSLRSE